MQARIVFFGSTGDSVLVLEQLRSHNIVAIVTQPPRPVGRKHIPTPTPTQLWAETHSIPCLSFATQPGHSILYEDEAAVVNTISSFTPDLLISASYGQKIPTHTIESATYGGLNVHPSLLPRWRGADPIPWQILAGDQQTGVTIVTINEKMDEGEIIAQQKIPLTEDVEREMLRNNLFKLGAQLLEKTLPDYLDGTIKGTQQDLSKATFARRLTREDGFIPWKLLSQVMNGNAIDQTDVPLFFRRFLTTHNPQLTTLITNAIRALSPWPGIWTIREDGKRMKILNAHVDDKKLILNTIQIEGKTPSLYEMK